MTLKIGTRGSALALWQAHHVADLLRKAHPGLDTDIVTYKTTGDNILDRPLAEIGGKGLFTKELEVALAAGDIHIAVHSLKDMPTSLPDGMVLGAIPSRGDVRDCVLTRQGEDTVELVGTASLRRGSLAHRRWSSCRIEPIRGNVQTRVGRLFAEGDRRVDAVILAQAGLLRLRMHETVEGVDFLPLNPEHWIPAVGQGALAIECMGGDQNILERLAPLNDPQTAACTRAERAFLRAVEGDCRVPVGAYATADGAHLRLKAFIGSPDGQEYFVRTEFGTDPDALGQAVAEQLLDDGGADVLRRLREHA